MHSLRAAFTDTGITTPPFTLRRLAQHKGISPPITMRKVLGLPPLPPADFFPENTIAVFKDYNLTSEAVKEIIDNFGDIPQVHLPEDIPRNKTARQVVKDRKNLLSMLKELVGEAEEDDDDLASHVTIQTKLIGDLIEKRESVEAFGQIEKLKEKEFRVFKPDDPIWQNALRTDRVFGATRTTDGIELGIIINGYRGEPVDDLERQKIFDVASFLQPNSQERRFRVGLLTAESLVGQREFKLAIDEYEKLLGEQGFSNTQRKFLAIRMATAQSSFADQLFNQLSPEGTINTPSGVITREGLNIAHLRCGL